MNRIFLFLCLMIAIPLTTVAQDYEAERRNMVDQQILNRGIRNPRVLDAMRTVQRHRFVPEEYRHMAYSDRPLPIGHEQTISQPYIVALMTDYLNLKEGEKVLEIGTGSGYQAAVLAELVDQVYSVEIVRELAQQARTTLSDLGYDNVHIHTGDGYKGWPENAPYDAIIVTASPTDVPPSLKEQLAEGGRMVIPVGGPVFQKLVLLRKIDGKVRQTDVTSVRFVPMVDEKGDRH
jgi:protein-L-isoaspartate(D-aspartate) O-methyltransferase